MEQYYVIERNADGEVWVMIHSLPGLKRNLEEEDGFYYGKKIITEDIDDWDNDVQVWPGEEAIMIIKGTSLKPVAKEVVTKYEI